MREFKSLPQIVKSVEGRTVSGVAAVFGNIDFAGDRIHPGAFTKTIQEAARRARHLWNHDFSAPPIAAIKLLKEIPANELPPEVKEYAPEATGGLWVEREYLDTPRGNEVLAGIQAGAITEMSFGFDPIKIEFTTEGEGADAKRIRELKELRLYDTSDVLWGMNNATVANAKGLPLELIAQTLEALTTDVKAGRRNATNDLKLINAIHSAAVALGCEECKGIVTAEESDAKSRAEVPSLTHLSLQLQDLELAFM